MVRPQTPYQAPPAHTEAAHIDMPPNTEVGMPRANNTADTPPGDAADVDLILCRVHYLDGPVCDDDPPAASTLPSLVPPPLPLPAIGRRSACFSLCALLVDDPLPNLILSGL